MENKFSKKNFANYSNEELLEILESPQSYQSDFVTMAEIELKTRNLENKSDEELLEMFRTQNPYLPQYSKIREELLKRGKENDINKIESEIKLSEPKLKAAAKEKTEQEIAEKRKKTLPYRIGFAIIGGIIGFFLVRNYIETNEKENIKKLLTNGVGGKTNERISNISLLKESGNKYKGLLDFESGKQMKVNVIVDGDDIMWESDGSYERQNTLENYEKAVKEADEKMQEALKALQAN